MRIRTKTIYGAWTAAAAVALASCSVLGGVPLTSSNAAGPDGEADEAVEVRRAAERSDDPRIIVSLAARRLWLMDEGDTVFGAPIAIGRGDVFRFQGKTYRFATPRGQRTVLGKEKNPAWSPPDWHYYEKASRRGLEAVKMERGKRYQLSDSTVLVVRGNDVGRINRFGNYRAWTPGMEIIFDGKIFIPPYGTRQRAVPDALGTHKLDLGDGYLIHGTHSGNRNSIGRAASHGCIRMYNEDVSLLYRLVEVGTPVYIY